LAKNARKLADDRHINNHNAPMYYKLQYRAHCTDKKSKTVTLVNKQKITNKN